MKLLLFFLGFHMVFCLALLVLRRARVIGCEYIMLFNALFLPVWGAALLLCRGISDRRADRPGVVTEALRPRSDETVLSTPFSLEDKAVVPLAEAISYQEGEAPEDASADSLYDVSRSIVMDEDTLTETVVPLEEALIVNDTATRRALIIDVLYTNPGDYISQLYAAKANGDTEVVHYAATALAEIQKEFDLAFQDILRRKEQSPQDEALNDEYRAVLEKYIASGLLAGDALKGQLRQFAALLEEKLAKGERKGRWTLLNQKADIDLQLGDAAALDRDIERMTEHWPDRERIFLFKMQSAMLRKDSARMKEVIDEIRARDIYASPELKGMLRFWDEEAKEKDGQLVG